MSSGHGSYQRVKVWGNWDILWLSNNSFYSHGETLNFVTTPWTRPLAQAQASSQINITKAFRLKLT